MNGERVGLWTVTRGEQLFAYDPEWLASPLRRPLSLSMPLRPGAAPYRTRVVQPFFDNLLPDSVEIRRRMRVRFETGSIDPFDLLAEAGRDCVGAVQLLPADSPAPNVRSLQRHAVTEAGIAATLSQVRSPSMGAQDTDDLRISLAGAQEKTAFLRHQKKWWIPEGTTPTTHIFKLPIRALDPGAPDLSASVENEWLCAQLLTGFGVPCAKSDIAEFKGQKVLIVERFDRVLSKDGSWILRLPQEDLCQVTATPPDRKYEAQGGPGILAIMEWLRASERADEDRDDFFRTQFLFWLLCAIDGHAKNFSVFIEAEGRFRLTPRYDVISAYPFLGPRHHQLSPHKVKLAMAVHGKNRHYRWKEIRMEHWLETARLCKLPGSGRAILESILERVSPVLDAVARDLPRQFPETVSRPILNGLQSKSDEAKAALAKR